MEYKLNKNDIQWNVRQFIDNYVLKSCIQITGQYNKYPDMSGFTNNIIAEQYKDVDQITIKEILYDNIIILFKYNDNKKTMRVFFVKMLDIIPYHDLLVEKYFSSRIKKYRDVWKRTDIIKSIDC